MISCAIEIFFNESGETVFSKTNAQRLIFAVVFMLHHVAFLARMSERGKLRGALSATEAFESIAVRICFVKLYFSR